MKKMLDLPGFEGRLEVFRRPHGMPLYEFLAAKHLPVDYVSRNIFVNGWYVDVFNVMTGASGASILVGCLALGTGALPPTPTSRTDSALVTEWRRYLPIGFSLSAVDPPQQTFSFYAPASDGAIVLTEAGLFHGGATVTPLSGRMSSHAVFAYSKPNNQDIRIDYVVPRSLT